MNPTTHDSVKHDLPVPTAPIFQYPSESEMTIYEDTSKIHDWLVWSIINLFISGIIPAFVPLTLSILCRRRKAEHDINAAKRMSNLALVFNIIITIVGIFSILSIIIFVLDFKRFLLKMKYTNV